MCSYIKGLIPKIEHIKSHTSENLRELWSTACSHLTLPPAFLQCPRTLMRANGNFPFQSPAFLFRNTILIYFPPLLLLPLPRMINVLHLFLKSHNSQNKKEQTTNARQARFSCHIPLSECHHTKMALCIQCKISLMLENVSLASRFWFICYSKLPHYIER
jgi:hypothetical protein